jgi:hypothetical protein
VTVALEALAVVAGVVGFAVLGGFVLLVLRGGQ